MGDTGREPVAVLGLGRFGVSLALELTRRGTEVLAIDSSDRAVAEVSGHLTQAVTADCTDREALDQLGLGEFARAVVAIGDHLEASILVTSLLGELGVRDIWAKASSARHARILERVGAHHVVLPEQDMGERVAHLVSGRMLDYMQIDPEFAMAKIHPPRDLVGVAIGESRIQENHGVHVVAVKHGEQGTFTHVSPDTSLEARDVVLVVGHRDDVDRLVDGD